MRRAAQAGISLVIVLILLFASVLLGTSAAVIALQAEKASRGDRDRQSAFQAAEAALIDAQLDIDTAGSPGAIRTEPFSPSGALGFPPTDQAANCVSGQTSSSLGLCKRAIDGQIPSWLAINLADTSAQSLSVPYGRFTQQKFPTGQLALPAALPRYVIELMPYHRPGMDASASSYAYRITAIGFGANSSTQVVLQAFYRKEN